MNSCSFTLLNRIFGLIICIMLKFDVFYISIVANRFPISSKMPQMNQFSLNMLRISSRFGSVFNKLNILFTNIWFLIDFDIFNKFEIYVTIVLEIDVLSRFSFELVVLDIRILWSSLHKSIWSYLRSYLAFYDLTFTTFFNCWWLVDVNCYTLYLFRAKSLGRRANNLSLSCYFCWSSWSCLFIGLFRLLVSLSSDWLFVESQKIIYQIIIKSRGLGRFLKRRCIIFKRNNLFLLLHS